MSAKTHELGRYFLFYMPRLDPKAPLLHVAPSWEASPPFRVSDTRILRLWPFNKAVAWGYWCDTSQETVEDQDRAMGLRPYKKSGEKEGEAWELTDEEEWA